MSTTQTPPTDRMPCIPTARPRRRRWIGALVVAAIVIGTVILWWAAPRHSNTRTETFDADVSQVIVDVSGRVTITAGERTEVAVTREWGWVGAPAPTVDLTDGVLRVEGNCGTLRSLPGRCLTHVTATVDAGAAVTVTTSAGAVDVTGTTAGADLTTSSGRVQLTDVTGPVRVRSSAGSITGSITSDSVDATTSAGSIILDAFGDLQQLSATSSAGTIQLTVPDLAYRVETGGPGGAAEVNVRTDPNATRSITARAGAGDITIDPRQP